MRKSVPERLDCRRARSLTENSTDFRGKPSIGARRCRSALREPFHALVVRDVHFFGVDIAITFATEVSSRSSSSRPVYAASPISQGRKSSRSCRAAQWSREKFNAIAETSQFADHLACSPLLRLRADGRPAFLVSHALVKNLPNEATEQEGSFRAHADLSSDRWPAGHHLAGDP